MSTVTVKDLETAVANGVSKVLREVMFCFVIAAIGLWLYNLSSFGRDSTDAEYGGRSGFTIKTDAFTGCQYLESSHGLTPRLDRNGKHICNIKKE